MKDLLTHLTEIKDRTEAWVAEDPANRWACYPVVDLAHWAQYGITTVEQFTHYNLVCEVFEATRSAFGYKPNWGGLNQLSNTELQRELEELNTILERQMADERAEEAAHIAATERAMTRTSGFPIGELVSL